MIIKRKNKFLKEVGLRTAGLAAPLLAMGGIVGNVKPFIIPSIAFGLMGALYGAKSYYEKEKGGKYNKKSKKIQTTTKSPITPKPKPEPKKPGRVFNEPYKLSELLKKYPKLRELNDFITNYKILSDICFKLDDNRIILDWMGLECDLVDEERLEFETLRVRDELDSDDWISCLGGGELVYNKVENCFYVTDIPYDNEKGLIRKTTIPQYKKDLLEDIQKCIKTEIDLGYMDEDRQKIVEKEIINPLKRALKI
jgi:hypothetical protein